MEVIEIESPADVIARKVTIEHYSKFATILDSRFSIPGTQIKFGVDSIVGLFPGAGDLFGLVLSLYIVYGAASLGVRTSTLLRMIINVGADFAIGVIPIFGDILDIFSKSNLKNVKILQNYKFQPSDNPRTAGAAKRVAVLVLLTATFTLFAFSALIMWGLILLLRAV